jgi:hypothetical protein
LTCLQVLQRIRLESPKASFEAQLREAIETAYLGRIQSADRRAVVVFLRAAGLPEE